MNGDISARRIFFRGGGSEVHQGKACKGGHRVGGSGGLSPPEAEEVFQKFVKKQWKNYNFLYIFKKISRFFSKFFEILSNVWRKFGQKVRKFRNMDLSGVRGAEPPDASEFLEIWVEKSIETCDFG